MKNRNIVISILVVVLIAGTYFALHYSGSGPLPVPDANGTSTSERTTTPPPVDTNSNARTLYEGSVEIEPASLSEIKARLEAQGCHTSDYHGETTSRCSYIETIVRQLDGSVGIEVYPRGMGFGPASFYLTENKLWSQKDIKGAPNAEIFKDAVRQDVSLLGNVVTLKENSWEITKMKYPWTVIY